MHSEIVCNCSRFIVAWLVIICKSVNFFIVHEKLSSKEVAGFSLMLWILSVRYERFLFLQLLARHCIKNVLYNTLIAMIVVTATLLFVLLFFAPIRFRVNAVVYVQHLMAKVQVRSSSIKLFDETFELIGRYLHCEGTVSTDVDLTTVNRQAGIDFLKCITIDKVCVTLANNLLGVSTSAILAENVVAAIAMATLCNISHCQLYTQVVGTVKQSNARFEVVATTSVAELSFCLLWQGVKLWKTRTSKK